MPSCSSLSPCYGKASPASSGSENTGVHDRSPGRWSAIPWNIWSVRQRTSIGLAGRTCPKNKSSATLQSGVPRTGSILNNQTFPSSPNTNTWRITWVTSESPRHGEVKWYGTHKDWLCNLTVIYYVQKKKKKVNFCCMDMIMKPDSTTFSNSIRLLTCHLLFFSTNETLRAAVVVLLLIKTA